MASLILRSTWRSGIGHELGVEQSHADQLLADRRCAGHRLPGLEVLKNRAHDAAEVHAWVGPEGLVLGRDLGLEHDLRHLRERDLAPILDREGRELAAVGGDHRRALDQVEVLDVGHVGQAAGEGSVDAQDDREEPDGEQAEGPEDQAGQGGGAGSSPSGPGSGTAALCGPPTRRWSLAHRAAG